jgi:hypothetical protein
MKDERFSRLSDSRKPLVQVGALTAGKDQVVAGMFKTNVKSDSPFALKVLDRALVLLGLLARVERAEVLALARLRVYFARVEAVLTRLQLSDHFEFLFKVCVEGVFAYGGGRSCAGASNA